MKKTTILLSVLALTLTSCQRGCQQLKRGVQSSKMHYDIKVYSGGVLIRHDNLETIINNSENSDGCYYYKGDSLIEVSGDCVITAL